MNIFQFNGSHFFKRKTTKSSFPRISLIVIFLLGTCITAVGGLLTVTSKAYAATGDSYFAMPSWWNGDCDSGHNPGSHSIGSFRGIEACIGPSSNPNPDIQENFGGTTQLEWECVELVMRYMKLAYNQTPYWAYGKDVVNLYPGGILQKIANSTPHQAPQPGDIISYDPFPGNAAGHTSIVTATNVDPGTGNGEVYVLQQNASHPTDTLTVKAWKVSASFTSINGWLHDPTGNTPAVVKNKNGELEAFARTNDGFIKHIWQRCAGCGWLSDWVGLSGGTMQQFTSNPAVANNAGLLEVFAIGIDHNLWHTWEQSDGSWVNWQQFSGGTILVGDPVVTLNQDGRMEVFVRQDNGTLWDTSKKCPGSCGWNSWYDLTSSGLANHYSIADDPTVTLTNDGRLELFARTADNSQNVFYVAQSTPGGSWGFWRSLGGYALGKQWVVKNYQGELEVFARASDSSIWHNWENTPGAGANGRDPGSNWHGWIQLASGYANNPMVAVNANGEMEVFVRGADQHIYHDYQVSPGGSWSGWQSLIGGTYNFFGDPFVAMNADGRLELFARGITNQMYHDWQNSAGNGPTSWSPFAGGNLYTLGTVQFR